MQIRKILKNWVRFWRGFWTITNSESVSSTFVFFATIFLRWMNRLDWQQLDDILQVPYEGQIKNPNIFGLFICPYKNCGKQFPQKLLFQDHLKLFHDFPHTFSCMLIFQMSKSNLIVAGKWKRILFPWGKIQFSCLIG